MTNQTFWNRRGEWLSLFYIGYRNRWWIAGTLAAGAIVAGFTVSLMPRTYRAWRLVC